MYTNPLFPGPPMNEQAITVDGAVNLRDLGGYAGVGGALVRRGKLFRSGTLNYLSENGVGEFAELDVGLICDLRREDERAQEPTPESLSAARLEIPINPGSIEVLREKLAEQTFPVAERIRFMTAITAELITDHAEDYALMFEGLLGAEDGGFLVHCSAGKDRTGVGCALILHALGVPREVVVQDYLLTNQFMDYEGHVLPRLASRWELDEEPDRDEVMALAGVRLEYIQAAYAAVEQSFDDVEHYIRDAIGLGDAAFTELRRRYLEPC